MTTRLCDICDQPLGTRWTDQPGVGECVKCGADYNVAGFNGFESTKIRIATEFIEPMRAYWEVTGNKLPYGMLNTIGTTQEEEDTILERVRTLRAWLEKHHPALGAGWAP